MKQRDNNFQIQELPTHVFGISFKRSIRISQIMIQPMCSFPLDFTIRIDL